MRIRLIVRSSADVAGLSTTASVRPKQPDPVQALRRLVADELYPGLNSGAVAQYSVMSESAEPSRGQ